MPPVADDALCIRHWDWSETSQTVSLLTRDHGLVRCLAKGSRRPKSPYSGGVELLTRGQASIIIRPSSDLALLTAWDLEEMFPALRASLAAHNAGMYMADLVQHAVSDHDPHPGLFDALVAALRGLGSAVGPALLGLQWALLAETGYAPVLEGGAPDADRGTYLFSARLGGVVPGHESREEVGAGAWPVRAETVHLLRALSADTTIVSSMDGGGAAAAAVERANRLLAAYIRHVLGREVHTLGVVFGHDLPV